VFLFALLPNIVSKVVLPKKSGPMSDEGILDHTVGLLIDQMTSKCA